MSSQGAPPLGVPIWQELNGIVAFINRAEIHQAPASEVVAEIRRVALSLRAAEAM
jgi:hypothetical protein